MIRHCSMEIKSYWLTVILMDRQSFKLRTVDNVDNDIPLYHQPFVISLQILPVVIMLRDSPTLTNWRKKKLRY